MAISDWPRSERPREKLLKLGPASLSDAELLAIFLRTGCSGKSAVDLARDLLNQFKGLRALLEADQKAFCRARGLGDAKYTQLQAVLEMSRRHLKEKLESGSVLSSSASVKSYLNAQLRHRQQEIFAVIFLDNQHRLLAFEELFTGTINSAQIHPREIVKRALYHNAAALILAHNHPSGCAKPSQSDEVMTKILYQTMSTLDIRILDHLIVGNSEVFSMAEYDMLPK